MAWETFKYKGEDCAFEHIPEDTTLIRITTPWGTSTPAKFSPQTPMEMARMLAGELYRKAKVNL
jgi:hypothetical protein